jgi:hypothetical protein
MNIFKLHFDNKKDATIFMDSLPANRKTKKTVINDNCRIDLRHLKFVRSAVLDVETKLTEQEFRNLYNL